MAVNIFDFVEHYPDGIKVDLIDLELGKDGMGYYLSPKYRVETTRDVKEIYIPKARLRINLHQVRIEIDPTCNDYVANLGIGKMRLYADKDGHVYYETIIEEKTVEMTMEDIEKKLGHKIKIVSKGD